MDTMKILKRAWYILWNYRTLWVFGFLLALTVGGASFGNLGSNSGYRFNNNQDIQRSFPIPWEGQNFQNLTEFRDAVRSALNNGVEAVHTQPGLGALVGFTVAFIVLVILFSIGMTILRYVSETATIRMVDEFDASGQKVSINKGFHQGWSPAAWKLFLVDLLISFVPGLILLVLIGLILWGFVSMAITTGMAGAAAITMTVFMAGMVFLLVLVFGLYFVLMGLVRNFIARALILEQVGIRAALHQGFSLVQKRWKDIGLFWLVMIGLGLAWWIVSLVLVFFLIPFFIVSLFMGLLIAGIPGLLVGLFSSLFVSEFWPIVIGVLFGLPLFIPVVASPMLFVEGLALLFRYTVWNLVYREVQPRGSSPEISGSSLTG